MHSLLRQAEAPVDYECTAGSVPGRGFAFEATNTCSYAKERERKKREWPKDFSLLCSFHVHFYVSFSPLTVKLFSRRLIGELIHFARVRILR